MQFDLQDLFVINVNADTFAQLEVPFQIKKFMTLLRTCPMTNLQDLMDSITNVSRIVGQLLVQM
jgi:hypothetical protein